MVVACGGGVDGFKRSPTNTFGDDKEGGSVWACGGGGTAVRYGGGGWFKLDYFA